MRARAAQWVVGAAALACAGVAWAGPGTKIWTDPRWDNSARCTNEGGCGPSNPASRLPDLLRATLSAWQSPTASTNPYSGSVVANPSQAHLFRLDLAFDGLLNPPGRLGDGEVVPYEPFAFGESPVYGFLEIDVDSDKDTGGELGPAAKTRYLANIARFGKRPHGSIGARAAVWGTDLDNPFGQAPEYRASGTDFLLALCGCFDPTIVSEGGNGNHIFDAGETWIVRGAFFQRAGGYKDASFCFGGSSGLPGLYDPLVNLRFSHSLETNQTTISLVYALDMVGAGQLAGQPAQPVNYNAGDQTSLLEGVQDVIDAAESLPLSGPTWTLAHRWNGRHAADSLDVTAWDLFALFGTACATRHDSSYIWTDTGFGEPPGDVDGTGATDGADRSLVRQRIIQWDAGPLDAEGPRLDNGQVRIFNFGLNFCLYDVTGDGYINDADLNSYCTADFDRDGRLTILDFSAFLNAFIAADPRADFNHNGVLEVTDLSAFSNAFVSGCP